MPAPARWSRPCNATKRVMPGLRRRSGARELPRPVKDAMAAAAKVMTTVSYRL